MVPAVDARQALDDLMEVSAQVDAAAVLREDGTVEATTLGEGAASEAFAAAARELVQEAGEVAGSRTLTQLDLLTGAGCVFLVRHGARAVVAATRPQPTVGLVVYDL